MSSNAPTQAAVTATEPSAQPAQVVPKTVTKSPVKKTPGTPVKAPEKIAARRAGPTVTKKAVATPAKPKAVKAVAPNKATLKPKAKATKVAPARPQKIKMVRDSFTFPETEHKRLVEMKKRLIALGMEVKKGELVRAGLEMLASLDNLQLAKAVADVEKLKTGRPKK
ncbi:MAG TPA: hypothetical protein DCY64_23980 [Hydrogenophaga sp.]|uniref:hypothetical protein n=1 Tax=Hydrogenophaga sp. TaxID=1904254 RepID=UPI0008C3605F|nr:hypothetical protein [Hydrogenophaga sp.]OGA76121.1 MAG: hypothetical protein A2X73_17900 [Burkholderiales bacterium GWE1_65_30]OGA91087.1 MAG: hypothetical protein A2X72_14645 [Burkholderiales bacterium GWF1_66_17]HAX23325.1 hypothetical protein [Hydrogenophaga sp.]HBU19189.1 hypothetical protein [Hydrogenophaga sp.]